jgi:hypothetical protein
MVEPDDAPKMPANSPPNIDAGRKFDNQPPNQKFFFSWGAWG